jgi:serine/threonine protein kinase
VHAQVADDVREALEFLHASGVVHCDVQPGNIVWFDEEKRWKLIDLEQCGSVDKFLDRYGPPHYLQPGIFQTGSTPDTDLYALKVVVADLRASAAT